MAVLDTSSEPFAKCGQARLRALPIFLDIIFVLFAVLIWTNDQSDNIYPECLACLGYKPPPGLHVCLKWLPFKLSTSDNNNNNTNNNNNSNNNNTNNNNRFMSLQFLHTPLS